MDELGGEDLGAEDTVMGSKAKRRLEGRWP